MDYALKSLVVCGNCGRKMMRHEETKRFQCAYGRNGGAAACGRMRSPVEADLEQTVFNAIQDYMGMAEKKMIMVRGKMSGRKVKISSDMERMSELRERLEDLKHKKLELYEGYCEGYLEKAVYIEEKGKADAEIRKYEKMVQEMKAEMKEAEAEMEEVRRTEREIVCEPFRGENELTYEMAHGFVEKILVYPEEKVEIVWNFRDVFEEKGKGE